MPSPSPSAVPTEACVGDQPLESTSYSAFERQPRITA